MSEPPLVDARPEGRVCVLTLRREAKLNALSSALEAALGETLGTDEVRRAAAVVLTGAGRAFSAGADVSELSDRTPEDIAAYYATTGGVYEQLAALSTPTLSAIHGYCLGGGLELALATDFRIADETAQFGFPEVGIGILPSSGGIARVARLLGPAKAKELMLLNARIDARQALAHGLITEVVPEGEALERALAHAQRLADLPRLAAATTKQAIEAAAESSHAAALMVERLAYAMLAQTEDARGGP